jgi:hypothetical protein
MKTRNFFMLFAVALLWCGCSKIDNESVAPIAQTDDDDARLIGVSASAIDVTASQSTRAAITAETFSDETARVLATKVQNDYSSLYSNGTMTFKGESTAYYNGDPIGTGGKYYPADNERTVYLNGLYPSTGWSCDASTSISGGSVTHTVDGCSDLMYAPSVESKLGESNDPLRFDHVLTLLNLKLSQTGGTEIITVTKIELIGVADGNVNTTCNVNLTDGGVTFSSGSETTIACYRRNNEGVYSDNKFESHNYGLTVTPIFGSYVLAPALDANEVSGDVDYKFGVTYYVGEHQGVPPTFTKPVPVQLYDKNNIKYAASTKGQSFVINLIFRGTEITAKATIAEWGDGGTGSGYVD